jgi:hypothetical protein
MDDRFFPGQTVVLTDDRGGRTGILKAVAPTAGTYGVHTIKLIDGTWYRTEGRLSRPTTSSVDLTRSTTP